MPQTSISNGSVASDDTGSAEPPSGLPDHQAQDASTHRPFFTNLLSKLPFLGNSERSDALAELLEEHDTTNEGGITQEERALLSNIHAMRSRTVDDIKIPRADIVYFSINDSYSSLRTQLRDHGHSRLPIVEGSDLDNVLGMLHVKDLLLRSEDPEKVTNWSAYIREVLFVVPSLPVMDLLRTMRDQKVHMALVVDEYGGIDGLVTIEDLVEQIVGDIADEHDTEEEPMLKELPDGSWQIDARFEIEDFEKIFGLLLTDTEREEDIDTLGGLVFTLKGSLPSRGQVIIHESGVQFSVLQVTPKRIKMLHVSGIESINPSLLAQEIAKK